MSTSDLIIKTNFVRFAIFLNRVFSACSVLVPVSSWCSDQSERTSNIFIAGITTANYMRTSCYASSINCHNSVHNNYLYGSFTITSAKRSNSSKGPWQSVARQFAQKHRRSATGYNHDTSVCRFFEYRSILIDFSKHTWFFLLRFISFSRTFHFILFDEMNILQAIFDSILETS